MKQLNLFIIVLLGGYFLAGCGKKVDTKIHKDLSTAEVLSLENSILDFEKNDYQAVIKMKISKEMSASRKEEISTTTIEYDADNKTTQIISEIFGNKMEMIETAEHMYTKMNEKWIKIPADDSQESTPIMNENEIKNWIKQPNVKYLGEKECEIGKCKVYEELIDENKTVMFLDTKKNRPVKIMANMMGSETTITYNYEKEITIEIPEVSETNLNLGTLIPKENADINPQNLEKMIKEMELEIELPPIEIPK